MTGIHTIAVHFDKIKIKVMTNVEGVTVRNCRRGSFMTWLLDTEWRGGKKKKKQVRGRSLKITPKLCRPRSNVISEKLRGSRNKMVTLLMTCRT